MFLLGPYCCAKALAVERKANKILYCPIYSTTNEEIERELEYHYKQIKVLGKKMNDHENKVNELKEKLKKI